MLIQNLQYLADVNPPQLERQALTRESSVLKMGRLLVGKQYHLLSLLAGAIMHYANATKQRPASPATPVRWLDPSWLDADPLLGRLVANALADCPEYATPCEVPRGVRYLAFAHEFPIDYLDLDPPASDALTTSSVKTYSRLFYLLGLFCDARLCHDPIAQRVVPTAKAVDLRMAEYTLRGYDSEDGRHRLLDTWGLDDLRDAALHVERNSMLLSEVNTGVSGWFFEQGIYWYKLAVHAAGLWSQLCSLARDDVRSAFSAELAQDLHVMSPAKRVGELLMAGLPAEMVTAEACLNYIASELDP
jgi:hypothetical protein